MRIMRIRRGIILAPVLLLFLLLPSLCLAGTAAGPENAPAYSDAPEKILTGDILGRLGERLQESMDEMTLRRMEQNSVQEALGGEILAAWNLADKVTADTPWLIRVNQSTCTVTVCRVLQVGREEIPFASGYGNIMQEALTEAREASDALCAERASVQKLSAQGLPAQSLSERSLRPDPVLMEFRKITASKEEPADSVTVLLPVYVCPCSVGVDGRTPNGTFTIQDHLRWHELVGPTWGQWCCHFAPSYLFHSLPYDRPNDPDSLQKDVYNLLGKAASHGCVRLAAVDAKYIYDHVPTGGKVEIFTGSEADDPIRAPERPYVGEWEESYDPTDPEFRP